MDGASQAIAQNRDIAELMTSGLQRRARLGCRRSAEAGADAAGICLGGFPHLGQNAARYLSEGDFRSDGWSISGQLAQNAGWREVVAQRQKMAFPPGFVSDVDAVLAKNAKAYSEASVAVNKTAITRRN